jgi:hypothetical protein
VTAPPESANAALAKRRRNERFGGPQYGESNIVQVAPHSDEAEKGVLGSMMKSPRDAIPECVEKLNREQFFNPIHRAIFNEIVDLHRSGRAIDLITFTQLLRDRNLLDSVGGAAYVTELFTFVPTAANLGYYIEIVREKHVLREIIAVGTECVCRARGNESDVSALLADATEKMAAIQLNGNGSLPVIQDASALVDQPEKLPDDVIAKVLHRGGKMVLGGASKSYKTWTLIDLAVSVATGSEWFNGYATKKGRVLYVNFEIQAAFFTKRIRVVCDERQLKLEPHMLDVWNLRGHSTEWKALARRILSGVYDLIIIDPIYKLLNGRDENKAGDIASMLNEIEMIAVRTGAAVAFGAHYSKGNQSQKESIDRIGGSGVFARDPDSILNFTKHEQQDCFAVEMTLRNHPPRDPFVVKWEYPMFTIENTLDPARLKQPGRKPDESLSAHKVLDLLSEPMTTTAWQKLAEEELGASKATFHRRKSELENGNKIRKDDTGKWSLVS